MKNYKNYKKIILVLLLISNIFILNSCVNNWNNTNIQNNIPEDVAPDVKTIYVQSCKNKDSKCKQLICSKEEWIFNCTDSISWSSKCSDIKSYDNIVTQYKICSENKDLLDYSIFNYSEKRNEYFEKMTPNELEQKLDEELKKVENWWNSDFLWPFMASMWWALIWWLIANKLFGWNNIQMPVTTPTENNKTFNKDNLNKVKTQSKTETEKRNKTRLEKREAFKKKIEAAKKSIKKKPKTYKKKSFRRFWRRR